MDGISGVAVGRLVAEGGIFGLGWILFIFMMFREIRERKRYSDLVIHIIQYFTKIRMVDKNEPPMDIPAELFDVTPKRRVPKRRPRSSANSDDDA